MSSEPAMSAASLVSYVIGKLKSDEAPGDMSGSTRSPPTPQLTTVWRTKSIPYDIPDTTHPFRNEGSLLKLLRTKSMPLLGREGSSPQRLQPVSQQAHAHARSQSPSPVRHPRNSRNMSGHLSDASESTVPSLSTPPPTPRSPSPTRPRSRSASDGHLWQRRKKQLRRHTDKVMVTLPSVKDLRGKFDEKTAISPTDKQPPASPAPVNDHALKESETDDGREGRRMTRHYSMLRPHLKSPERRQPPRQAVTPDNVRKILEKFENLPQVEGEEGEVFSRSDSQKLRSKSRSEVTLKTSASEVPKEDQTRRRTSLQGRQRMKNHRRSKSEPDPSAVLRHYAQTSPPSVKKLKLLFEREALAGGGSDFAKSTAPERATPLERQKEKTPESLQVLESRGSTAGETEAEESSTADQQLLGVVDATGQREQAKTPPVVEVLTAGTPSVRSLRQRFEEGASAQSSQKIVEEEVASKPRRAIAHQLKTPFEESLHQKSRSVSPEKESRHSLTSFSSASVKNLMRQFEALSPEVPQQAEQEGLGREPMSPSSPQPIESYKKLQTPPLDSVTREAQHDAKPEDKATLEVQVDSSWRRQSRKSSSESSSDDEKREEHSRRRQEMEQQREKKEAENEKERQRIEQEQKLLREKEEKMKIEKEMEIIRKEKEREIREKERSKKEQEAKEKEEKERTLEILEKEREAKKKLEEERKIRERKEQERLAMEEEKRKLLEKKNKEKEKAQLEIRKREREEKEREERERAEEKKEREKQRKEMEEKAEMERRERERVEREKAQEEEKERKKRVREEAERLRLHHEQQEEKKRKEETRRKREEFIRRLSGEEVPKGVGRDEARENDKKPDDKPSGSSNTPQGEASSEQRVEQLIDQFTNLRDADLEWEVRRGDTHHRLGGDDIEDEDADDRRHSDVAALVNKFRKLNARRRPSSSSESDGEGGKPRTRSVKEEAPIPTIPARSSGPGKVRTLREDEMRFFESAGGGTEPFQRTQSLRVKKSEQSHFTQPRFGSLRGSKSNKSRVAVIAASSTTNAALPRNCRRLNSDELQFFTGEVTNIYRNRTTKSRGRAGKIDRSNGRPLKAPRSGALPDTEEFFRIAGRAEQGGEPNGRPATSENESDSEPSVLRTSDDVITDSESDIYELDINLRSDADTEDTSDTEDRSELDQTLSLFVHSIQGELLPPVATEGCGEEQSRCYVVFSPETHPWSSEDEDEMLESSLVLPTLTENVPTPVLKENGISLAVHLQEGTLSDAPEAVVFNTPAGYTKTEQISNSHSEGEDNTLHPPRQHYSTEKDANSLQKLVDLPQHSGTTKENDAGIDFLGVTKADLRPSEALKGLMLTELVTGETGETDSREASLHLLTLEKRDSSEEKKVKKKEEDNVKKMEKKEEVSVKVEKKEEDNVKRMEMKEEVSVKKEKEEEINVKKMEKKEKVIINKVEKKEKQEATIKMEKKDTTKAEKEEEITIKKTGKQEEEVSAKKLNLQESYAEELDPEDLQLQEEQRAIAAFLEELDRINSLPRTIPKPSTRRKENKHKHMDEDDTSSVTNSDEDEEDTDMLPEDLRSIEEQIIPSASFQELLSCPEGPSDSPRHDNGPSSTAKDLRDIGAPSQDSIASLRATKDLFIATPPSGTQKSVPITSFNDALKKEKGEMGGEIYTSPLPPQCTERQEEEEWREIRGDATALGSPSLLEEDIMTGREFIKFCIFSLWFSLIIYFLSDILS